MTKASEEAATAAAKGYQDYLDQIQTATEAWAEAQAATLDSLANSAESALASLAQLTDSLKEFGDALGQPDFSGLNPARTYAATKNALNEALASGSYDLVQSLGQSFIEASKAVNGNSSAYIQDRAYAQAVAYSAAAANMDKTRDLGMAFAGLRGFDTGGSMLIGGNAGIDQNVMSLNGQPVARVGMGELLTVTPKGQVANDNGQAELVAEVRALRQQLAEANARLDRIDRSTARLDRNLDRVTEGGEHMLTEAAS